MKEERDYYEEFKEMLGDLIQEYYGKVDVACLRGAVEWAKSSIDYSHNCDLHEKEKDLKEEL